MCVTLQKIEKKKQIVHWILYKLPLGLNRKFIFLFESLKYKTATHRFDQWLKSQPSGNIAIHTRGPCHALPTHSDVDFEDFVLPVSHIAQKQAKKRFLLLLSCHQQSKLWLLRNTMDTCFTQYWLLAAVKNNQNPLLAFSSQDTSRTKG